MNSLETTYLGLKLKSPLVVGACPLTAELSKIGQLEEAGAGAVVLPSLFEEQIRPLPGIADDEPAASMRGPTRSEFAGYNLGPDGYLQKIEYAKQAVGIPVIASLNGWSTGGWTNFAELVESAGADAIELNVCFIPTDPKVSGAMVEDRIVQIVMAVRRAATIPIAVKLGQNYSALPHFAQRLFASGVDGLVLFNRYLEPHFSLETFEVEPHLELSSARELGAVLRWIAILRGQIKGSLAATSGIHDAEGALRAILAGADVAMLASALVHHGPGHLKTIHDELNRLLDEHGFDGLDAVRGLMSRNQVMDPLVFERANYTKALSTFVSQSQH